MEFSSELLAPVWLWMCAAASAVVVVVAGALAPWARLREARYLNLSLAATVAMLTLWQIRADAGPALEFHLLGVTALTLTLGAPLATVAVALAQLALTLNGAGSWEGLGANLLVNGLVPVAASVALARWVQRRLPAHFFVYIFVSAFAAGAVAMTASRLAGSMLLWLGGAHDAEFALRPLGYLPLTLFPEAFLNGGLMTLLVVYRPHWVASFDDAVYLKNR